MISRRSFNQAVIGIAAALALPFKGIASQTAPVAEMEAIGGEIAFNYPPSIYHTLCRYVEYHSPSRNLLLVEEIPHGCAPVYEDADGYANAHYIEHDGSVYAVGSQPMKVWVPTKEKVTESIIEPYCLSEHKDYLFGLVPKGNKTPQEVGIELGREFVDYENRNLLNLSLQAVPEKIWCFADNMMASLSHAFKNIEARDEANSDRKQTVHRVVCNKRGLKAIQNSKAYYKNGYSVYSTYRNGYVWYAKIELIDDPRLDNTILVFPRCEYVGAMPIRQDFSQLFTIKGQLNIDAEQGVLFYYETGFAMLYPENVERITFE